MAKSDRGIGEIDLYKPTSPQREPTWVEGKLVNAFDTETSNGTVFMLTYAHGNKVDAYYNEDVTELSDETIMKALTHHHTRSNLNVWYNLDFDANAILSGILTDKEMTELVISNECTTTVAGHEYHITYVKGKFLVIDDGNGHISRHYDISQYFYAPLDDAAENWLGENKIEGIDTSKFGDRTCFAHSEPLEVCPYCFTSAHEYITDNFDDILHYAKVDSRLTQDLALELFTEAENLDIPMGNPISTGYLSAEYLRANTDEKPGFGTERIQNMFWDSYYGGRFEVFQRGEVGEIAAPDINSAYPAIMKDLPDPTTLEWVHYDNEQSSEDTYVWEDYSFGYEEIEKGDYGVVRAKVTTDPNRRIQPFACKIDGKVKFPVMTDKEITVIKPIFEFAVNHGIVTSFELKEAWIGNETEETSYPFGFLGPMYAERKVYEKLKGKPKKGKLLKFVLNSSYGKTCQTTESRKILNLEECDGNEYKMDFNETQYTKMHLSKKQRELLDDNEVIINSLNAGKRFNPFFASYITGMTRLELHKQVVEHDLEEHTVMFATDCLMVEKEAYEKSSFDEQIITPDENLPESEFREKAIESLGGWDYDYKGDAFVVGSGVYEVDRDVCHNGSCENVGETCDNKLHRIKTKTRGFIENNLNGTLRELAHRHKDGIPIDNERPLTMAEVLINTKQGSVSEFINKQKELQPDFDDKRVWERESPTFHDLLNGKEKSMPIDLQDVKESKIEEAATDLDIDIEELRESTVTSPVET